MAGIPFGFLGQAIDVLKWAGSYLCCFTSNINTLKDEAIILDYHTTVLQHRVNADKSDGREEIYQIVEDWLTESGNITRTKERILAEAAEVGLGSGCFNYAKRVSLSKEAKETAEAMKELVQKCKFVSITRSLPIAAASAVPFGKFIHEFDSRKRFEEDIMTSLDRSKNVDKVGIWGIGGVGKTIMAQKILNRALEEGLFDEVVMVTVSQPVEKLVIQLKIAEKLGLTLDAETLKPRADKLRARLTQKKRTLILLDDVWEVLNLEELGIPCDGEWCTIILTSRNKHVFKGMKVENVCELGVLDDDEAWDFFKKMAGTCVDDVALNPIAKDVMRECKGLLVALESVGKAHEDEKGLDVWRDSLQQLRKHNPVDIPNVIKEVYRPLKLSYDRLESENAKSMILLCSLFAEDVNIPLEHLTYFAMGLRLFEDTWELEGVRGRIRRSIDTLKNRCLLLDSSLSKGDEDHVRMHDVVRDVSIFIASEERLVKCSDCTWISSHVYGGARPQSCFPKLKLLFMNNKAERDKEINIVNLIAGSNELSVLFIEEHGLLKSLPVPSLKTSLTTLVLRDCESLESIAVVGQLESLEILICDDCNSIKELPEQVKGLKHLKVLQISYCTGLKRVAAGVKNITSAAAAFPLLEFLSLRFLKRLEEIWDDDAPIPSNSFNNFKTLKLYGLPALKRMGKSVLSTAKDLFLQLETIDIRSCEEMEELVLVPREEEQDQGNHISTVLIFPKLKRLNLRMLPKLRSMICSRGIESIQFPLLAEINIRDCGNLKWISDDHDYHDDDSSHLFCRPKVSFPNLKILILGENTESKNIWCDQVPMSFFTGLVELYISNYGKIRRLFSSSSKIPQNLVNLQKLEIMYCKEMVKVIEDEEEVSSSSSSCDHPTNPTTTPLFPSLQELWLYRLRKLESFCEWRRCADLELPSLKTVFIEECDEMKSFNAGAGSIIITPALQTVFINGRDLPVVDDLNAIVHREFEEAKKRKQEEEEKKKKKKEEEEVQRAMKEMVK